MATGKVVRYGDRGWGFIRPDDGGRDVFMHIGDVAEADRDHIAAGRTVGYEVISGERGPRAVKIVLVPGNGQAHPQDRQAAALPPDDGQADYLSGEDLRREVTAALAPISDAMTAAAEGFLALARKHGWSE